MSSLQSTRDWLDPPYWWVDTAAPPQQTAPFARVRAAALDRCFRPVCEPADGVSWRRWQFKQGGPDYTEDRVRYNHYEWATSTVAKCIRGGVANHLASAGRAMVNGQSLSQGGLMDCSDVGGLIGVMTGLATLIPTLLDR